MGSHSTYTKALFVLVLISSLVLAAPPANLTLVKSGTFQIPANVQFSETVYVEPGQYVVVDASGKWRYDPRPQFETGPDGLSNVFTTFKPGMLQGKFGDGDVFPIGSHWEGYATNRGRLALGIYEPKGSTYTNYVDNIGNLTVSVKVYAYLTQEQNKAGDEKAISDNTISHGNSSLPKNESVDDISKSGAEKGCIAGIVLFICAIVSLAMLQNYNIK
ncbi:MAG: hypothetical protein QXS93_04450 [Candidatus Micrarchaeia archaeon]